MGGIRLEIDVPRLFKLWASGMPQFEICQALGIRPGTFWQVRQRYALPPRPNARPARSRHEPPPTPEEIAERASLVRAGWTDEEKERRAVGRLRGPVGIRSYTFDRKSMAFSMD